MAKTSGAKKNRNVNGFTKTPNSIFSDKRLNSYDKIVLIVLIKHQFKNDFCFPSHHLISKEAGCSRDTVIRSLKKLKSLGYISWYKTGKHNIYKIDTENR